jgi:regulator of replication initiation timing
MNESSESPEKEQNDSKEIKLSKFDNIHEEIENLREDIAHLYQQMENLKQNEENESQEENTQLLGKLQRECHNLSK